MDARQERQAVGQVRIGLADSLCSPLIAEDFFSFRREYPGVALTLYNADTSEMLRMLDHNEVDLICTMDIPLFDTSYVTANEESVGVHFVVSPAHPLARKPDLRVEQLLEYPFLLTEKGMSYRRVMDEMLAERSLEVRPVLETGRADVLCRLAEEGAGISLLPDYVTEASVREGRLIRLEIRDFQIQVWKQILYRKEKWISPQMQAVIGHLSRLKLS